MMCGQEYEMKWKQTKLLQLFFHLGVSRHQLMAVHQVMSLGLECSHFALFLQQFLVQSLSTDLTSHSIQLIQSSINLLVAELFKSL